MSGSTISLIDELITTRLRQVTEVAKGGQSDAAGNLRLLVSTAEGVTFIGADIQLLMNGAEDGPNIEAPAIVRIYAFQPELCNSHGLSEQRQTSPLRSLLEDLQSSRTP